MFITGLGTATPATRYTQAQCWEGLQASPIVEQLSTRSRSILKKVLGARNGIETRCIAADPLSEVFTTDLDVLHQRFAKHAPALCETAARRALQEAGITTADVDGLIVATCTGYLCPGLTSYVSERLGLSPSAYLLDIVGQGCAAALPVLRAGEALITSGRHRRVLCICVEVCSAVFYLDNDPGVLISACLFGDGAAAAVLSDEPVAHQRRVEWLGSTTQLGPQHRDLLRFELKQGFLRNVLTPEVPGLAADAAEHVARELLRDLGVGRHDIRAWIFHAGGRDVLSALSDRLKLSAEDLRFSTDILREYGNMSSPFVLFVLQRALQEATPDGPWWMSSFGAGFSCHGALLKVGA